MQSFRAAPARGSVVQPSALLVRGDVRFGAFCGAQTDFPQSRQQAAECVRSTLHGLRRRPHSCMSAGHSCLLCSRYGLAPLSSAGSLQDIGARFNAGTGRTIRRSPAWPAQQHVAAPAKRSGGSQVEEALGRGVELAENQVVMAPGNSCDKLSQKFDVRARAGCHAAATRSRGNRSDCPAAIGSSRLPSRWLSQSMTVAL
jgi:hypothetical protein